MLPEKTFITQQCTLFESDFQCNGQVSPHRVMQLLQDIATHHAELLGVGWEAFDRHSMLWVLSKIKLTFHTPVTRQKDNFTLYTWPLAPSRFFAERCFSAVDGNGQQLFSATSLWTIISRAQRKILPAETMNEFFKGEYSQAHSDTPNNFARIRKDDTFQFCYEKQIRRSDLDKNGHVNNTNYVTYALDVLAPEEKISAVEIVFNKELLFGDKVKVFFRRDGNTVQVVGESSETNFTVIFTLQQ